jgi:hypothetical protein
LDPALFRPGPAVPLGAGAARTGATLITESHRRQSNVSKAKLSGLDLLANIATPQIGQCLMDFRRTVIAFATQRSRRL